MNIQDDLKKFVSKQTSSNTCSTNTELVKEAFMSGELNKDNFEEFIVVLKDHGVYFELFKPQYEDFMFELFNQKRLPQKCFHQMIEWITYKIEIMTFISTKRLFKYVVENLVANFQTLVDVFDKPYSLREFLYYGERHINVLIENNAITTQDMQHLVDKLKFTVDIEEFIKKPTLMKYALTNSLWNSQTLKKFRDTFGIQDIRHIVKKYYEDQSFIEQFKIQPDDAKTILNLTEMLVDDCSHEH